jgi:hypothetical protein
MVEMMFVGVECCDEEKSCYQMSVMPAGNKSVVDSLECTYCFVEEARARVLVIRRSATDSADGTCV